jgi:DNA-binding response OmpR family regulator
VSHIVVLVDDEPDIREIATMSLEAVAGWRVLSAASGAEGIELALAGEAEAMLLDAMMPELDGPATLAELRAREQAEGREPLPVIMLTAKTQGFGPARVEEIGAQGLIAKPFDPMKLGDQVAAILGWA